MHADMRRFRRRIGERDGAVEGDASSARPSCMSSAPFTPKKWKVAGKLRLQRLDQGERAAAPRTLATATARLSVTTGEGRSRSSVA